MRILAHRGAPDPDVIENTVAAVTAAFAGGADGVEVDLRLTADDVLVVWHDADLLRLCGDPHVVASSSWEQLRRAAARAGVPLARVEWVLAAAAGRPVVLELKPGRDDSAPVLADRLSGLAAVGLDLDVTVSSFDARLVELVRRTSGVRTALLGRPGSSAFATLRTALEAGHNEVHLHVSDLLESPDVVLAARALGAGVVPWTVNPTRTIRRCADLGVDALITDRPRAARHATARAWVG